MPAFAKPRVLTVEDDPIVRADLRLILGDAGFALCPDARDGLEAIELAHAHRPDLILIDLHLPGIDGVEATRRILDDRQLPIVALTGYRGDLVQRAHEAGAVAHVLKPFHQAQLVGAVTDALSNWRPSERPRVLTLADEDHHRQLALVEELVRRNYSEREITAALGGHAVEFELAVLKRLGSRIAAALRHRRQRTR